MKPHVHKLLYKMAWLSRKIYTYWRQLGLLQMHQLQSYWTDASTYAICLMDRMPSRILDFWTPLEVLVDHIYPLPLILRLVYLGVCRMFMFKKINEVNSTHVLSDAFFGSTYGSVYCLLRSGFYLVFFNWVFLFQAIFYFWLGFGFKRCFQQVLAQFPRLYFSLFFSSYY